MEGLTVHHSRWVAGEARGTASKRRGKKSIKIGLVFKRFFLQIKIDFESFLAMYYRIRLSVDNDRGRGLLSTSSGDRSSLPRFRRGTPSKPNNHIAW